MIEKVNLSHKFSLFSDHWQPKILGQINDLHVKVAKLKGEFVWHHHDQADEMFLVIKGHLRINVRDQEPLELDPGEFVIIPRGVEHQPVADDECEIVMIEPVGTLNTGNVQNERTVAQPEEL